MKASLPFKLFSLATALPLLAIPIAGHADAAMDACIEAFVSATLPKDQPLRILKDEINAGPLNRATATERIELGARISRSGAVIALNTVPAGARVASAAQPSAR